MIEIISIVVEGGNVRTSWSSALAREDVIRIVRSLVESLEEPPAPDAR